MIYDTYSIGPQQVQYTPSEHLAELDPDNKVVIHFSGGVESTLCALMCIEKYGKENVQLVTNNTIYCRVPWGTKNSYDIAKVLDLPIDYLNIDPDLHYKSTGESTIKQGLFLRENYNAQYVVTGFTGLYLQVLQHVTPLQKLGSKKLKAALLSDPNKFAHTIMEFYVITEDYLDFLQEFDFGPNVLEVMRANKDHIMLPLNALTKPAIVDLWHKMGLEDILYLTRSCIDLPTGEHCGKCFNCQQRYDAFYFAGYEDPTEYKSDKIKEIRYKHEHLDKSFWRMVDPEMVSGYGFNEKLWVP